MDFDTSEIGGKVVFGTSAIGGKVVLTLEIGGKVDFDTAAGEIGGKLVFEIGGKLTEASGGKVVGFKTGTSDFERGGKFNLDRGGRATVAEEGSGGRGEEAVIAIEGNLPAVIGGNGVRGISLPSVFSGVGEVKGIRRDIGEVAGRGDIGISGAGFIYVF